MQRVCFCKTVSLFNHILQPSQSLALFYQSLIFALKNLALIKWISSNVDIPIGLQLLMIDINGNVTVDDELLYKQLSNNKRNDEQQKEMTSILKWISRIVLRLSTDCSVSSKSDRSLEFESLNEFLKQFHNDRSTLSDDDEGISNDDLDDEDISRRAIHHTLIKCIDYATKNSFNTLNSNLNPTKIQDIESHPIALYNQQIIQILCSDTLELEIELARDSHQSSYEFLPQAPTNDNTLINYYSVWAALWRDVTVEYLQFNDQKCLRKVSFDHLNNPHRRWSLKENERILDEITKQVNSNDFCLHDRLMFEIKQKPNLKSSTIDSHRKRIRPIKAVIESDLSSDDEYRDEFGRKRVVVVDCLLQSSSSSSSSPADQNKSQFSSKTDASIHFSIDTKIPTTTINYPRIENLQFEHISMEKLLRVCLIRCCLHRGMCSCLVLISSSLIVVLI